MEGDFLMENLLSAVLDKGMLEEPLKQFEKLQDTYISIYKNYCYMLEENIKMREELYRDNFIAELKTKNELLSKRLNNSFEISTEEWKKINEWKECHKKECLSNDFIYCFELWDFRTEARIECKKCGKFHIFCEE